jgi:hypothetical protein
LIDDLLSQSVVKFSKRLGHLNENDLEVPWIWKSYDSDGIRFAFFRTYEELQELAVRLEEHRRAMGNALTSAQIILGTYHQAYRDLQVLLSAMKPGEEDLTPAAGEWTVRRANSHIFEANLNFHVAIKFALDLQRRGGKIPDEISDAEWDKVSGIEDDRLLALREQPIQDTLDNHQKLHNRIIFDFNTISDTELEWPSRFWEDEPMSIRFRLHRFDSHMQQHKIQIEKTLLQLRLIPSETARLMRMIYRGLAVCETQLIGLDPRPEDLIDPIAKNIAERADELVSLLRTE